MLGQVVADQHVEQVAVTGQIGTGERDELAVTSRGRELGCSRQDLEVAGHEGGGDQKRCGGGVVGHAEYLGGRIPVAADQGMEEGTGFVGHLCTMTLDADEALTVIGCRSLQ